MRAGALTPLPQPASDLFHATGSRLIPPHPQSLVVASPHSRHPVKPLPPAPHRRAGAAAGRRRWGPGAPTHLPGGALSIPRRAARGRVSRAGGRAVQPILGGKPPRGAVPRTWTAYFPSLLLCVNGPHPPQALPTSRLLPKKKPWAIEVESAGGVPSPPAPAPRPPGAPLARPSSAFVPRAALRAAGGQRRGPGPRTKKAAGPGRRPLPAPPLASPAGAAAPRTKGPGGGGGAACPGPDKARGPGPRP